MKRLKLLAVSAMVLACVGCGEVVLHADLPEKEANEMMALLLDAGLSTTKTKGAEHTWQLTVAPAEFAKAVAELRKHGFPREQRQSIGDLFKKSGLVSSPTEERVRLMHGLSQELSDTICQIDGVLTARVHIVLPTSNPYGETTQPASASVFIKHRPRANLDTILPQITKLVASSIEGLKYENVSTVLTAADEVVTEKKSANEPETVAVAGLKLSPDSLPIFWTIGATLIAIVVLQLGALAYFIVRPKQAAA